MKIEFITSNKGKYEEAKLILSDWEIEQVNIDLTEIQGNRFDIMKAKTKEALRIINRPLFVEDVSLCCSAIGGLPGPYIKDFLKTIGDDGLYELIHKYEDHSVQTICVVGYIKPGSEPLFFEGIVEGNIVAPRGKHKHGVYGWNPIVQPLGSNKTYGEMSIEEQSKCSMRSIALNKLKHFLESEIG
jgi:inosine triphosphate pyrophosphatase